VRQTREDAVVRFVATPPPVGEHVDGHEPALPILRTHVPVVAPEADREIIKSGDVDVAECAERVAKVIFVESRRLGEHASRLRLNSERGMTIYERWRSTPVGSARTRSIRASRPTSCGRTSSTRSSSSPASGCTKWDSAGATTCYGRASTGGK